MKTIIDSIRVGDKVFEASQVLCEGGNGGDIPSRTEDIEIVLPNVSNSISGSTCHYVKIDDNRILLSTHIATARIYLYKINSKECIPLINSSKTAFKQITSTKWFLYNTSSGSNSGLILYDSENDTCTQLTGNGDDWRFQQMGDKFLCSSRNGNGFLNVYNASDNTFTQLVRTNNYTLFYKTNDTKCVIVNESYSTAPVCVYNSEDNSLTEIPLEQNVYQTNGQVISQSKVLLINNTSYWYGIYVCDVDNNTLTKIYDTTVYGWSSFMQVASNKWLIGGSNSNAKGVLLFNSDNNSITPLGEEFGAQFRYFVKFNENKFLVIAGSSSYKGILVFNSNDDTLIRINTSYYSNTTVAYQKIDDNKMILNTNALALYKSTDDSINSFTGVTTSSWRLFENAGDKNYYIINQLSNTTNYSYPIFYYDDTTETIRTYSIKVEV